MVSGKFRANFWMVLGCFWDGLGWFWDGFGMVWDDFSMIFRLTISEFASRRRA